MTFQKVGAQLKVRVLNPYGGALQLLHAIIHEAEDEDEDEEDEAEADENDDDEAEEDDEAEDVAKSTFRHLAFLDSLRTVPEQYAYRAIGATTADAAPVSDAYPEAHAGVKHIPNL